MCICAYCNDEDKGTFKDPHYGWICPECREEYGRIDRETNWDEWDAAKRERIAEGNEY